MGKTKLENLEFELKKAEKLKESQQQIFNLEGMLANKRLTGANERASLIPDMVTSRKRQKVSSERKKSKLSMLKTPMQKRFALGTPITNKKGHLIQSSQKTRNPSHIRSSKKLKAANKKNSKRQSMLLPPTN